MRWSRTRHGSVRLAAMRLILVGTLFHLPLSETALAQGIGYLAAAAGPVALGILHEATDGWLWPDVLLAGTVLVLVALGGAIGSRLHRAHAFERIAK